MASSPTPIRGGSPPSPPACPVCDGRRSKRLLTRPNDAILWRCGACGLAFARPLPPFSDTQEHFADDYIHDEAVSPFWDAARTPQIGDILSRVEAMAPPEGAWLDIGSATGSLFQVALQRGASLDRFYAVEPSHVGQQAITRLGVPVCADAEEIPDGWPTRYAVVSLLDMLYFVPDPCQLLARAASLLAPGGILALDVPTFGYEWARGGFLARVGLPRRSRVSYATNFLYYFTRRSLQIALARLGLEDLTWSAETATYDIHRGLKRAATLAISCFACAMDRVVPATFSAAPKLLVLARRRSDA